MDLGDIDGVVKWMMTGGAVVVVSWFASWGLEKWAWWQSLSSKVRSALILVGSSLLGLVVVLIVNNETIWIAVRPYAQVILTTIIAWLGTQTAHRADSERK